MKVYADLGQLNKVCRKLKRLHFSLQDESARLNRLAQHGFSNIEGKSFEKIRECIEREHQRVKQYVRILEQFVRSLEKIIQRYQECEKDAEQLIEERNRVIVHEEQVRYRDLRNMQKILKKLSM